MGGGHQTKTTQYLHTTATATSTPRFDKGTCVYTFVYPGSRYLQILAYSKLTSQHKETLEEIFEVLQDLCGNDKPVLELLKKQGDRYGMRI